MKKWLILSYGTDIHMDPLTKEDGIINDIGRVMAAKRISKNGSLMVCCRDIIYEKDLYIVHVYIYTGIVGL